ncbi:MAG: WYL domain-containing protein [Flavobacteriales bacterium]|nr:WYL domain-containing protein [Flavobacteriales bacterium]
MPTNKHAQIRYQALDRCFRARGRQYFWEDLLEACNEALSEYSGGGKGISRRQLFEDIKYMESDQGWSIPLERHKEDRRVWYRYSDPEFSINNQPLNEEEADQLKEALLTLNRFKGMPQFQWVDELVARLEAGFGLQQGADQIIEFEENPYLKGAEHITTLFHAILQSLVLEVTYQGFRQPEPVQYRFHPYYLKQYNNRWFAFGWDEEAGRIINLALDRIQAIASAKGDFIPNADTDFTEFFDDVVGVSVPDDPVTEVVLRVHDRLWPYLDSKPLHHTQTRLHDREGEGVTIRLRVKPNFELMAQLLSHGDQLEVVAPPELREQIAEKARAMARTYHV